MNILGTFIEQASNIWWGIVAAVFAVALLYATVYFIFDGKKKFSPLSLLVAVPLLPMLAFQFFLLFGSVSLKDTCTDVAGWIDAFVPETSADGPISRETINEITSQAAAVFPIATKLIDVELLTQENGMSLGEALTHKVHTYLNWYIVRRSAWSIGFVVIAVVGIVLLMEKGYRPRSRDAAARRSHSRDAQNQRSRIDERTRRQQRRH